MLNYKTFDKERLAAFTRGYGFESVDDEAFVRVVLVLEVMVHNLLNNARRLSAADGTLKKAHFEAVMSVVHSVRAGRGSGSAKQRGGSVFPSEYFGHDSGRFLPPAAVSGDEQSAFAPGLSRAAIGLNGMSGGSQVLPSEYFGLDSGRFLEAASVSGEEQSAFAPGLSRAAIVLNGMSGGGGKDGFVSAAGVRFLVDQYKAQKRAQFKVSPSAYAIIGACLAQNLARLAAACKAAKQARRLKRPQLTLAVVTAALSRAEFQHMAHGWKQ